jgi:hypothetical protein
VPPPCCRVARLSDTSESGQRKYLPVTKESAAAAALEKGGPDLLKTMKAELRRQHVGKQTAE